MSSPIEFQFEIDAKSLKELGKIPAVRAGIIKDQKLWSWKREIRSIGGSVKANKIVKKQWGDETVGVSLASVFANTSILKEFGQLVEKKGPILLSRIIQNAPDGAKAQGVKQAANSFAALLKQAYMAMSKKRRNSPERARQKGFDQYAIGTGQTIQSIRAESYEVRK